MAQEPLQFLPSERWSELQNVFKKGWPRSVVGHAVLETQRDLMEKGFDYGFKVYCPFGDVWNGMVAINIKEQFYEVIILCPRDDTEKLEDALRKTKIIDWNRPIIIPFAPYDIIQCVQNAKQGIKLELLPSETFVLITTKIFEDINLPQNVVFGLLTLEHLDLVDSTWPHRYPNSSWYFELLIKAKYGYGLFQENKLISWVLINESGNLLHMYTVEEERKKGYGELLLKLVSNILIKAGRPVSAFCLKDNFKACKLYSKAGFVKSAPVAWCYINKED